MGQSCTKSANLRSIPFPKMFEPFKIFSVFLFARVLPLARISAILDHIGGVRVQKPPKNGYFMDNESVRKALEIFN